MKKILTTGLTIVLPITILIFLFKWVIIDFLAKLFGPLILFWFGKDYLVIPLTVIFTFLLILLVGFLFSRSKISSAVGRIFRRIPKDIQEMPGALVEFGSDVYFISAIIKETELKKGSGEIEKLYVLYGPSSPIPWTGLPIIFAKKEQVIRLKISFRELYGIVTSFGRTTPELLEELKISSTD